MFAACDIIMFSLKYLTVLHREKWFFDFLHNNIMSKIDSRSCYLYSWSIEWPGLRTGCSRVRVTNTQSKQDRQGEDKWNILKPPHRSDGIQVANLSHFPKYPTVFCLFIFLPHSTSLEARMGLGYVPGDKRQKIPTLLQCSYLEMSLLRKQT